MTFGVSKTKGFVRILIYSEKRDTETNNKQTTSSNSKKVLENPEELNTRTAPEEVSQFVQKNRQQSKLTTVNQLQAPQHLFLFS